ncbi:MAG: NAD(P)/FAD-dependent oxidoreductase [Mycobacteriales bacterium]
MRVLVIGAGIVGASAAYHLAKVGVDVEWVDRGDPGQATNAGAGVFYPWMEEPGWQGLAPLVTHHYPELVAQLRGYGPDPGFHVVGGITVVPTREEAERAAAVLREFAARPGNEGMGEITVLEPGEPAARVPVVDPDVAGFHTSGMGRVDGRLLRDALHAAALDHGARFRTGEVTLAPGTATVDGEPVPADRIVVAAGAWSVELCRPLGVELPVYPQRGQILHFAVADHDTASWPNVRNTTDQYLLGFPGGRIVGGATREEAGFDHRLTAGGVHRVLGAVLAMAPGLADATLAETRIGFRPMSRDGFPVLGPLRTAPDVIVATGLGRNGLTLGPYTGLLAADLTLDRTPPLDLTPYRPDR